MDFYPDIPRIYTAIAEWMGAFLYCILFYKKKIPKWKFAPAATVALVWQSFFLYVTDNAPVTLWLVCMCIAVFQMFLLIHFFTSGTSKRTEVYLTIRAFLYAEFVASLEWQIDCFFGWDEAFEIRSRAFSLPGTLLLTGIYALLFLLAFHLEKTLFQGRTDFDITWQDLLSALLIGVGVFLVSNLNFIYEKTIFGSGLRADIFNTRTLVDLGGLAILYAFQSRINETGAERELASIDAMFKTQYLNYRNYQESIDFINMKYHDLKHQIEGLKAEMSEEQRQEWIAQMEEELQTYRPELQTGNNVLDTIIAGKMITCQTNQVKLTCVADGKLLEFLHVRDICTIFGNALDNAIENVVMIANPEQRLIHLTVSEKQNFVLIRVNNYCEQKIRFKDGLPVTTKADKRNHGYGIKSIKYTAEKYGGNAICSLRGGWFEMSVLIPKQN